MDELCISIIVPIYNAEMYLERCIESIIAQTFSNWELILVDDGSTDNSARICDEYSERDGRIKVIHQKNAGVSEARNRGINEANGKYIGFVDSDDWIEPDMYECLALEGEKSNSDIVMCDAITVFSDGKKESDTITQLPDSIILTKKDITPKLLLELAGAVWRCIYNADLVKRNGFGFPRGVKFSEDRIFNIKNFGQANSIKYVKKSYYNRFINSKSAVNRFHADYFEACKLASAHIKKAIEVSWNNGEGYQKAYLSQLISGAFSAICNYYYKTSPMTRSERKIALMRLCKDPKLRNAIIKTECRSFFGKCILKKNITILGIYARIANIKHKR